MPKKQAARGLSWAGCRIVQGGCLDKTQPVGLDDHFLMDGFGWGAQDPLQGLPSLLQASLLLLSPACGPEPPCSTGRRRDAQIGPGACGQ